MRSHRHRLLDTGWARALATAALALLTLAATQVDDDPAALGQRVDALIASGRLDAAEQAAALALAAAEALQPPSPVAVRAALLRLTDVAIRQDDLAAAERTLERLERDHPAASVLERATLLYWRARLLRERGEFGAARVLVEHVLELRRTPGAPARDLVRSLDLLADLDWLQGRYEQGEGHAQETLRVAASVANLPPAEQALYKYRLAQLQLDLGDTERALVSFQATLARAEAALGPHLQTAAGHVYVAGALEVMGDYVGADAHNERAAQILEQFPDRGYVEEQATIALNRGLAALKLGDREGALERLNDALRLWTQSKGATHPHLAWAHAAIGEALADAGLDQEAHASFQQAVALRRARLPNSVALAYSLALLARSHARLGDCRAARDLAAEALAVSTGASSGRETLERRADRGRVAAACGDLQAARRDFLEALDDARRRKLPAEHPFVLGLTSELAEVRLSQGALRDAFRLGNVGARGQARLARRTLAYLPEADGLRVAARARRASDLALSAFARLRANAKEAADALELVANSRALVEDALARRAARQRASVDLALSAARGRLERLRARYSTLAWTSLQDASTEQADRLAGAQQALEDEERELARAFPGEVEGDLSLADLRDALPRDSALVTVRRVAAVPGIGGGAPPAGYLAFVLSRRPRRPHRIDVATLGPAPALDGAIDDWRASLNRRSGDARRDERAARIDGAVVWRAVWRPLAKRLPRVGRVLLVPDGPLALVNLAALPVGEHGYLADSALEWHLLSAERELLRAPLDSPNEKLVTVADVDYDALSADAPTRETADAGRRLRGRAARCPSVTADWPRLPATREEAADVAQLWIKTYPGAARVALSGRGASKAQLRESASRARILHLATHGLFRDGRCDARPGAPVLSHNPLLRASLALSGANRTPTGDEDSGLLTALEVTSLELDGVEWVVLSACGSALGQVQEGEGVLGLRRVFMLAGARTVIMSVTSVADDEARAFMAELYRERLLEGRTTAEAMRRASQTRLRGLRGAGRATPPYAWGAFVASGDWR